MHDRTGRPLNVGDICIIQVEVKELMTTEDYCNVKAETVFGRRPDGSKEIFYAINTAVMDKVGP